MKTALYYAEVYLARKRSSGAGGQTVENTKVVTLPEVIRQAQIDALRWAKSLGRFYYSQDREDRLRERIAELEAEAAPAHEKRR